MIQYLFPQGRGTCIRQHEKWLRSVKLLGSLSIQSLNAPERGQRFEHDRHFEAETVRKMRVGNPVLKRLVVGYCNSIDSIGLPQHSANYFIGLFVLIFDGYSVPWLLVVLIFIQCVAMLSVLGSKLPFLYNRR